MLLTCRKSCDNCGCEDLVSNCTLLANENKCLHDDYIHWMLRNCRQSCQVCMGKKLCHFHYLHHPVQTWLQPPHLQVNPFCKNVCCLNTSEESHLRLKKCISVTISVRKWLKGRQALVRVTVKNRGSQRSELYCK